MINKFDFVEQIYNLDLQDGCPVHVAAAMLKPDFSGRKRMVSGKGTTQEEALQTCLAEATERWCAIFSENYPGVWGTATDMAPAAISPDLLLLISDRQYENADRWNCTVDSDHHLPMRRDPKLPIFWVEAHSLTKNAKVLVPAAYCFLGYPSANEQGFPVPDSSGLAAGLNDQSCIERGLLELVERDAVSIWWYNCLARPEIKVDLRVLRETKSWLSSRSRKLWLLNLTHDLQIPAIAAISSYNDGRDLSFGFAAGWTAQEAITSALGELIQFEATKSLLSNVTLRQTHFVSWCRHANANDYRFLLPSSAREALPNIPGSQDMKSLTGKLCREDIEVLVLDLTSARTSLHTMRVLAPGLRPLWPRFAPGRLFDVPTKLEPWRRKVQEDELNAVPILY
jgi:thiazole/oxazole-forming peptide maturase SagD family component